MSCSAPLLLGVGNPFRHDDGVGAAVVERVHALQPRVSIDLVVANGEATDLLERWRDRELVIIVDASMSGGPPGAVQRLSWGSNGSTAARHSASISTHGAGVAGAIELARALDALPPTLVVFAVEALDCSDGVGLSQAVTDAVPRVAGMVLAEIGRADGAHA